MFGKGAKAPVEEMASNNIIGQGTLIKGSVEAVGHLRIEGRVLGNVHSQGKVVLGPSGVVEGDIIATNAEIGGQVLGLVEVGELLTLKPTAQVEGDIQAKTLSIEAGASFNGKCQMGESAAKSVSMPAKLAASVN